MRVCLPVTYPRLSGFFLENSFSPNHPLSAKDCFRCEAIKGVFFSLSSSFKSIKLRIFKGKEKPAFPEFHSTQDRGTHYRRGGSTFPTWSRMPRYPVLRFQKTSSAVVQKIIWFSKAHLTAICNRLVRPCWGRLKKGASSPLFAHGFLKNFKPRKMKIRIRLWTLASKRFVAKFCNV